MNRKLLIITGLFFLTLVHPVMSPGAQEVPGGIAQNGEAAGAAAPSSGQKIKAPSPENEGSAKTEVRISSFETKEEAEKFAAKLTEGGFETVVRSEANEDGKTLYRVYIMMHGELPAEETPEGVGKGQAPPGEEKPVGTPKSFDEIFGGGTGFYHASIDVTETFTDNAFLSDTNKKSGSSTVLSPEIWVLLPRTEQKPPELYDISTSTPGGLIIGRLKPELTRKYEAFLLYHADIPIYSNLPSENTVTHKAVGRFIYNGNNFSVDAADQFTRSFDETETGIQANPLEVDKYISNLFDANGSYDTGNRFRFMLDYSNFVVDYDDARNNFRNRMDNSVAGYVFYKIKPKTALFMEYDFVDISHQDDSAFDSREHNIFGGVQWDITSRSRGSIKVGYGIKDLVNADQSSDNYLLEAQIKHDLSSKNSITLTAYRRTDESDYLQTLFLLSEGIKADYYHRFTSRITGSAGMGYEKETYEGGPFTFNGVTKQRRDDLYEASLSFRYEFKKWLHADIGYAFRRNDSNFGDFSYTSNTFFFRVGTGI